MWLYLIIFILGMIFDRYILELFDLILQKFSNNHSLDTAKIQKEINEISSSQDTSAIGFHIPSNDNSEDDGIEDKTKSKSIGFKI